MKKTIAALLTLSMLAAALSGCSKESGAAAQKDLETGGEY